MIVLDASVLIAYLSSSDVHHSRAVDLIEGAIHTDRELLIHPVTLAEVLVLPIRQNRVEDVLIQLAEMGVSEVPFRPGSARALAGLRVTGLKMPDCIVLLTALNHRAALATFDDRLGRAATDQGVGRHV